ncbi:MAG TPA: arginine deiminase-related protein [Steroidobacteraceae bacterium]|nr:arginine deiminase-related protein [Steroidobacteraceae bacterium]
MQDRNQGESQRGGTGARQVAAAVLMVRPRHFGFNAQTAVTNRFQSPAAASDVPQRALREFDAFAAALLGEGVTVCVAEDSDSPRKPDAVFPNNWVSFHRDGTVVLYPMHAENRRIERRQEVIDAVVRDTGFRVGRVVDLTHHEKAGRFLEGTGSLVLDHVARVAYACRSPRTHDAVAAEWAGTLGYDLEMFDAADAGGTPIYHTNVLMHVGTRIAAIALDAISETDRARVAARIENSGREIVAIDHAEMSAFAGNMLEVGSWDEYLGDYTILVMSETARHALSTEKYKHLYASVDAVLAVPVETIERHGGGSVRCMLAEVFL